MINDALFTYYFGNEPFKLFKNTINFQGYYLSTPAATSVFVSADGSVAIIGLCVDSKGELSRLEIPDFLSSQRSTLDEFLVSSNRLAGNFVIIGKIQDEMIAINDPSGYLQINYHEEIPCFASNAKLISKEKSLTISDKSVKIREQADLSQPFPNNLTMYAEIKVSLPNHYLNVNKRKSIRYFPREEMDKELDLEQVVDLTIDRVSTIIQEYGKYYDLVCPLTAGTDSRLNLAFLRKYHKKDISTYTFNLEKFDEKSDDVYLPKQISEDYKLDHDFIDIVQTPPEYMDYFDEFAGDWHAESTINLAYTLVEYLPKNTAIINGDLVDQIGKSLIGNSVPDFFVNSLFLTAKIHNTSSESRKETKKWLEQVKRENNTTISSYDLFAWENRLGRWSAQGHMLYSLVGVPSLNIYNCRDIIYAWLTVSRKSRKNKDIHLAIFEKLAPDLLDYPFNPDDKLVNIAQDKWPLFLVGTYVKYAYKDLLSKK